jgi:glycosyltransferase involved in cell wall biosynthesis
MSQPVLGLVIPCFNEKEVLGETNRRLIRLLEDMKIGGLIADRSAIFYVDDGSQDDTWKLIEGLSKEHTEIGGIKLSCNRGHQNALLCGLLNAPGDILISVDADLQDDLSVIPEMVRLHLQGKDVVYGVRRSRAVDSVFKRFTAEGYYRLLKSLGVDIVFNHADFRLLSRKAINALSEYGEVNLFLRGLVRLVGLSSSIVEYDRAERFAGKSKYPIKKMLSFAWQGITSFSTTPLKLITAAGLLVSLVSLGFSFWAFGINLFTDKTLPGWTSTVIPLYLLGGVQMLSLGIIGEYTAKIYLESKRRPRFFIEQTTGAVFQGKQRN